MIYALIAVAAAAGLGWLLWYRERRARRSAEASARAAHVSADVERKLGERYREIARITSARTVETEAEYKARAEKVEATRERVGGARAAPPTVVEPKPPAEPKPVDLERGDLAPFAGTLIPFELAYRCADCAVALDELEARAERDARLAAIELERATAERDAERFARLRLDEALREASSIDRSTPLAEHPALWGGVGLIVGAGIALLAVWLAGGL
jgi:hypothetical protein